MSQFETSSTSPVTTFNIETSAHAFEVLSSTLYNYKILAFVREVISNAVDAHTASGIGQTPIQVTLPSDLRVDGVDQCLWLEIKDYGRGISEANMPKLYTTYFHSDKGVELGEAKDVIGGKGLGSKSPFCYTNSFHVTTRHNGVASQYLAFKDELTDAPNLLKVSSEECGSDTGITVRIPIKREDISRTCTEVERVSAFMTTHPELRVIVSQLEDDNGELLTEYSGEQYDDFNPVLIHYRSQFTLKEYAVQAKSAFDRKVWKRYVTDRQISTISSSKRIWVLMGGVIYPVELDHIFDSTIAEESLIVKYWNRQCGHTPNSWYNVVEFPIDDISTNAGREGLSYDRKTIAALRSTLSRLYTTELNLTLKEIEQQDSYVKMIQMVQRESRNLGPGSFEKGVKFNGYSFDSVPYCGHQAITRSELFKDCLKKIVKDTGIDYIEDRWRVRTHNARGGSWMLRRLHSEYNKNHAFSDEAKVQLVIVDGSHNNVLLESIHSTYANGILTFVLNLNAVSDDKVKRAKWVEQHRGVIANAFAQYKIFDSIAFSSDIVDCGADHLESDATKKVRSSSNLRRRPNEVFCRTIKLGKIDGRYNTIDSELGDYEIVDFDVDADTTHMYVVGDRRTNNFIANWGSPLTVFERDLAISRGISILAALTRVTQMNVYTLTQAQVKEVEGNPNWVSAEFAIARAYGALIKRIGLNNWMKAEDYNYAQYAKIASTPAHYTVVMYERLYNINADFKAQLNEWSAIVDGKHIIRAGFSIAEKIAVQQGMDSTYIKNVFRAAPKALEVGYGSSISLADLNPRIITFQMYLNYVNLLLDDVRRDFPESTRQQALVLFEDMWKAGRLRNPQTLVQFFNLEDK